MKKLKKNIALATMVAMMGSSIHHAGAQDYYDDAGYAYEDSSDSTWATPALALGAIALVAIIAVAVQNSKHGHSHSHD